MAEAAAAQASTPIRNSIGLFDVVVEGKIRDIDRPKESEWIYYAVQLKAADEYSYPRIIQISQQASQREFAKEGEQIRVKCQVSGYSRNYNGRTYISNTLTFTELV